MDRNRITNSIAGTVRDAITANGSPIAIVAQAADMDQTRLRRCLEGTAEFEVAELVRVGGFLRVSTTALIKEAA